MNSIVAGVKREYWEHRTIIVGLPLLISTLCIIAAVIGLLLMTFYDMDIYGRDSLQSEQHSHAQPLDSSLVKESTERSDAAHSSKTGSKRNNNSAPLQDNPKPLHEGEEALSFEFVGFFISAAWLACFYYLLNCLYADRKDKSILFWKSLPVSETQNVLTKLLLACIGIVAIFIAIAWLTAIFTFILALAASSLSSTQIGQGSDWEFSAVEFFLQPSASLVMGLIWGAPLFTYVLLVSAAARRSPFILLTLPPLVLLFLERIFFGTNYIVGFFVDHFPFRVLEPIASSANVGNLLHFFFVENGLSLLLGLILATGFIALAIWFRNNKFEL